MRRPARRQAGATVISRTSRSTRKVRQGHFPGALTRSASRLQRGSSKASQRAVDAGRVTIGSQEGDRFHERRGGERGELTRTLSVRASSRSSTVGRNAGSAGTRLRKTSCACRPSRLRPARPAMRKPQRAKRKRGQSRRLLARLDKSWCDVRTHQCRCRHPPTPARTATAATPAALEATAHVRQQGYPLPEEVAQPVTLPAPAIRRMRWRRARETRRPERQTSEAISDNADKLRGASACRICERPRPDTERRAMLPHR